MNRIDFTNTSGFSFSANILEYMQDAYSDPISALAQLGATIPANTPVKIQGMSISGTVYEDGWFYYNGELIRFYGSDLSGAVACGGSDILGYVITESATPRYFEDTSSPDTFFSKTAAIGCGGPAQSATFIPLTATFDRLQLYFGAAGKEEAETHLAVSVPGVGVAGDVYYKKNILTNTLQIRGTITMTTASNPATPTYVVLGTLAAEYSPVAQDIPFKALVRYHGAPVILDTTGSVALMDLNAELKTNGDLSLGVIKAVGASSYTVKFNTILPLD